MTFKERIIAGMPILSDMLKRDTPFIRQALVDGGAAGPIAVDGIKAGDQVSGVMHDTSAAILADLTSEFGYEVAKDGYIDNTGGTATTGDKLLVTWVSWS